MWMSCKGRRLWVAELELGDGSDVVSNVVEALSLLDTLDIFLSELIINGVVLRSSGWSPRLEDGPGVLDDVRLVAVVAVIVEAPQHFDEREDWRRVGQEELSPRIRRRCGLSEVREDVGGWWKTKQSVEWKSVHLVLEKLEV